MLSDAQIVLAFVCGDQTSLHDKKTALALAKECGPEVSWIAEAMGRNPAREPIAK